ncbi:dephospho-CoA kinase [Evansella sp. LMS18]|jgi:dephospho-CoA kinase|uniref:dephospho-CoA kinase n=1 Tax=Evansella sp. LMS18 TaxID=2924033 RepID=UPI0020D1AD6B|nr:dephospho-CoA kinase [Evansella sp. LMS18]UTR11354.1 dephospho-CoA kinase [Evansella sp. LMS18]
MIIGLTGGIASGKSTVSAMLKKRGFPVIDADIIARETVEPGQEAYDKIVQAFGEEILHEDNYIDRKKLGSVIFNDEAKRQILNDIVHPAVRKEMKRQAQEYKESGNETVIMDIPLLIESNLLHMVDKVLLVYVPRTLQLERLMKRDGSEREEAESRIASQLPIDEKKSYADAIIYNEGAIEETEKQLDDLLVQLGAAK